MRRGNSRRIQVTASLDGDSHLSARLEPHSIRSGLGNPVNEDPAREIAGLEYLFANKKDFGADDHARQKPGSVLI